MESSFLNKVLDMSCSEIFLFGVELVGAIIYLLICGAWVAFLLFLLTFTMILWPFALLGIVTGIGGWAYVIYWLICTAAFAASGANGGELGIF